MSSLRSSAPSSSSPSALAGLAPVADARIFFGNGGGDGIETAVKLARLYWRVTGSPERLHIISRESSYHGTHGYGTALAGIAANKEGWGPTGASISVVAHDSYEALASEVERLGPENVAAFFVESVIGAGGVHPPAPGYLEAAAALCNETGILFVADETICGFGRLGTWFGIERWAIEPDLVVFAKGVTSGYLPLGGLIVGGRVAEPFWENESVPAFRHGNTFSGHATCCAAALANLALLEGELSPPHPVPTGHSIRPRRSACRESRRSVWTGAQEDDPAHGAASRRRARSALERPAQGGGRDALVARRVAWICWPGRPVSRLAGSAPGVRSSWRRGARA